MIFKHFLTSANEGNAFIIACEKTKEALLVDVGEFEQAIADFVSEQGLHLAKVFITHDHHDHSGGLAEVLARYHAQAFAGRQRCGGCAALVVRHGDVIRVGDLVGHVLETPGHTEDSLSLYFPGMVFTGDALFAGSVGGTVSPAETARELESIRKHIFSLPMETEVHTGHGPSSTVAVESQYNPFFT